MYLKDNNRVQSEVFFPLFGKGKQTPQC